VNIYIAHYHFAEISSALNALSVHLKQKWFKETFKRVQIECVIQVHRETVSSWWASERECPSASCCKSVTRKGKLSMKSRMQMTTARQRRDRQAHLRQIWRSHSMPSCSVCLSNVCLRHRWY